MSQKKFEVHPGNPERAGVHYENGGLAFAFTIPDEQEAVLVLTDPKGKKILKEIPLPIEERTGNVSAVYLHPMNPDQIGYYYVVSGKKVLDPFAPEIVGGVCHAISEQFDWEDDREPGIPMEDTLIYKLHVRGFTKKAKGVSRLKGTFAGVAAKIPYIKELGFNAVELMPVYEFDETLKIQPFARYIQDRDTAQPEALPHNYWGYAEKNFYYSPKEKYALGQNSSDELRNLIKSLHQNGMECILEMYFPQETDPFSAVQTVRFWKSHYHVDGFHLIGAGTPVSSLVRDPLLVHTKLLFEQVDGGSVYGGRLPKRRNLIEYNDAFMNRARCLLKGDEGQTGDFAVRIRKNPDENGVVNYMANVNGFTLADMVSYDWKHNEENGEDNQDGPVFNYSWNCGAEGKTSKSSVLNLRQKQIKNAYAYLFLAQGIPLLLAGDESGNTQKGNNNAYAADNADGWTDWTTGKRAEEQRLFLKKLITFRKDHPILHMSHALRGMDYQSIGYPDISFHGESAWYCSFDRGGRSFGVMYCGKYAEVENKPVDDFIYIGYNAYWENREFPIPDLPKGYSWYTAVDTAAAAGKEFTELAFTDMLEDQHKFTAEARSVKVLIGRSIAEHQDKLEQIRIAEEKRRAEEEARRIAEEKRRAEEEARRLDEEKRRKEEEDRLFELEQAELEAEAIRFAEEHARAEAVKAEAAAKAAEAAEAKAQKKSNKTVSGRKSAPNKKNNPA
ncbi:MAG: alpha-amylase family glycosyl hydrolase [Lachnospiraceae bacterium]|nr:alpha-amylase family glycosyl hydrolase [Lachnospiraceae bacterium]